jgi:DNA-binding transcriptional LysR family regulator
MRGVNLDQFAAFAAVAELGSFSLAAERLKLTQPAVSVQIRQLEQRLGVRLFERIGRRVEPTSAGKTLLPHVRLVDEAVRASLDALAGYSHDVVGRVRIGTGATACIYLLPPALRDLHQCFPQVEIIVHTGNTIEMLNELRQNALDVAIVTLPASGRMFATEPLVDDEIVAVFPTELAPPGPAAAAELAALPLLLYEPGGNARRVIDSWFARADVSLKPAMELGNIEAIKQLVAAGLGCGLVPRLAAGAEPDPGGVAVRSLMPKLHRRIGLVMRRDKVPDRALRKVVAALRRLSPAHPGNTRQTTPSRASRSSSSRLVGTT